MRLKQLLGIPTLLLVVGVATAAAGSLEKVSVASQGNATTIMLQASGTFTHNEYRPADNLLLVDLTGVTAGNFDDRVRPLTGPGVKSYRVMAYTGASGTKVTRFELTLQPGATVDLAPIAGGVRISVSGDPNAPPAAEPNPTVAAQPTAPMTKPAVKPLASVRAAEVAPVGGRAVVRNIGVARGKNTLDIEIDGSDVLSPKAMKLTNPDRVVVDLANAVPGQARRIPVNSAGVKGVRVGQFQAEPPVTRVVVDLMGAHDYELSPAGNKVILKIRTPEGSPATAPAVKNAPAVPSVTSEKPAATRKEPAPVVLGAPTTPEKPAVVAQNVAKPETTANVNNTEAQKSVTASPAVAEPQKPITASPYVMVEPKVEVKPATPEAAKDMAEAASNPAPKIEVVPAPAAPAPRPAVNLAQQQQQQMARPAAPAQSRYTGEPISVNLKDVDLRDFFRLIHEISGLNIVLDPNVKGTLTLVLDDVPWDQALDVVLKNNGLDRQLEGNVLRVATLETIKKEADARRLQAEAQALAVDKVTVTRFLSYAHSKDVMPTIKKLLSQRGDVISDDRTNALIIQDIPSVIPAVDDLIQKLDTKTPEVEIEARVVAATRTFARDIGTSIGFGFGNGATSLGGAPDAGASTTQVGYFTPPPYVTIPGVVPPTVTPGQPPRPVFASVPLFSNLAAIGATSGISLINKTDRYRVDVILTAAEARGLLKILSRPRITTQNNAQAVVRQGIRLPIVTAAQLNGPPTTTWTDAFLRMTVTPQITVENTIFLNIDVENTTPDFSRTVNNNPTLITQQAQTQVLVTDGGTAVIAGVIQTQNAVNRQQVPLLGDIPVLGELFKRRSVSTSTQELIFFIMPKIIQT